MSDDYDFGFSFSDSDPGVVATPPPPVNNEAIQIIQDKLDSVLQTNSTLLEDKYRAKLKEVEGLILPLLYNLMKNPEKAYIKWDNRTEVIQRQIDKITAITRS